MCVRRRESSVSSPLSRSRSAEGTGRGFVFMPVGPGWCWCCDGCDALVVVKAGEEEGWWGRVWGREGAGIWGWGGWLVQ